MSVIKIMIVEDTVLIRKGLRQILSLKDNFRLVDEVEDGGEVLAKVLLLKPDVVLMDIHLPGKNGIELTGELQQKVPSVKVLALTIDNTQNSLSEMIKAGASGYILKDIDAETLYEAIETVARGEIYIDPRVSSGVMTESTGIISAKKSVALQKQLQLTGRELEIMNFIACGESNKMIAGMLYISEKTVKNHVSNILKKMGVEDRTQIAAFYWMSMF